MKAVVFWVFCVLLPVWCAACAQQAPASASATPAHDVSLPKVRDTVLPAPGPAVETIGSLEGGPVPPRTLANLLPPTSPETLDELRLILAEQERTQQKLSTLDYDGKMFLRNQTGGHDVKNERLVQVVRGVDNAMLVTVEQADAVGGQPKPNTPGQAMLRNSGRSLVSRFLRLSEEAVQWVDVMQPFLIVTREEDWRSSQVDYDYNMESMVAAVDPTLTSFGFGGRDNALDHYVNQALSKGDEYWRWEVKHEPNGLVRIREFSRVTPDFCDYTFLVDMAHGGVVIEAAWRPRGKQGPYRIARNTFAEYEGVYVPMEHTVQEFDGAGTSVKEMVVKLLKYAPANPDRPLTLDDLQAPVGAIFARTFPDRAIPPHYFRKDPSGLVPIEKPQGPIELPPADPRAEAGGQ